MQGWFNIGELISVTQHINRMKGETTWSSQLMQKKHLTKFTFHDKNAQQTRNRGKLLSHNKGMYEKPTVNVTFSSEA